MQRAVGTIPCALHAPLPGNGMGNAEDSNGPRRFQR